MKKVLLLALLLFLAACGGKEAAGENPVYDSGGPQDGSPDDFMPISEGFEEYSVWIETSDNPDRDSSVNKVFVFENDEVTAYKLEDTTIEDVHDLSDEELVKLASESTNKTLDELADNISSTSISESVKENKDGSFEDIYLEFKDGKRSPLSSKYTLDITIDELGQNSQEISLEIPDAYYQLSSSEVTDYDASGFIGTFSDYYTYTTDPNYNHELENYSSYLKTLEKYGSFKEKDGYDLTDPPHPQTYVPDPIAWETTDEEVIFSRDLVNQTIFETTFSGLKTDNGSLLTRVDDSIVGFKLDSPDTDKKNVTVEGK